MGWPKGKKRKNYKSPRRLKLQNGTSLPEVIDILGEELTKSMQQIAWMLVKLEFLKKKIEEPKIRRIK